MIFPHTDLNQQFSMLYKYSTRDQRNALKEQGSNHNEYSSIVGHFKHALEESDICIDDIVRYQSEVRIDNNVFLLNIDSAANCAAELFIHYLQEIMTPDSSLGIYMGMFYIAGTQHISDISEKIQLLKLNDRIEVIHESLNPYDAKALKIMTSTGIKIGYIPRALNIFPYEMIDNGEKLIGQIKKLVWTENSYSIKVMLYCQK